MQGASKWSTHPCSRRLMDTKAKVRATLIGIRSDLAGHALGFVDSWKGDDDRWDKIKDIAEIPDMLLAYLLRAEKTAGDRGALHA